MGGASESKLCLEWEKQASLKGRQAQHQGENPVPTASKRTWIWNTSHFLLLFLLNSKVSKWKGPTYLFSGTEQAWQLPEGRLRKPAARGGCQAALGPCAWIIPKATAYHPGLPAQPQSSLAVTDNSLVSEGTGISQVTVCEASHVGQRRSAYILYSRLLRAKGNSRDKDCTFLSPSPYSHWPSVGSWMVRSNVSMHLLMSAITWILVLSRLDCQYQWETVSLEIGSLNRHPLGHWGHALEREVRCFLCFSAL